MEDPNTTQDVLDKFGTFEIVVVWELDVKIIRLSKQKKTTRITTC